MGERTLLELTDGTDNILLYLHWYNKEDCLKAVKETLKNKRNNMDELAKFVVYFIQDHEEQASIYILPQGINSYGEDSQVRVGINGI